MATRATPYELILEPLERSLFPLIREEAAVRGTDTRRRDQFVLLGHVGAALRDIVADDASPAAMDEYADLLYHGYQFWAFGRRLYVLDPAVADAVTAPTYEIGDWVLGGPPSCYVQLPYQRLWGRVAADAPYEPVDGCFIVVDDTEPAPDAGAHLRVQLVLGLRAGRPGVSLVSYRTDLTPRTRPRTPRARGARTPSPSPTRSPAASDGASAPSPRRASSRPSPFAPSPTSTAIPTRW